MSYTPTNDFLIEVNKGNVAGHSIIHKFGRNTAIPTAFTPVCLGGVYQTPQPASATTLRIKAGGNAADTAAGAGAREITLVGLDETGAEVTEAVATAGASASAVTTATFMRLFRAFVSASGTYTTLLVASPSHVGDIVIENGAGGTDWATIDSTTLPNAQSEIGIYSLATGFTAQIMSVAVFSDSSKVTVARLFRRESILDAAAPFQAMRTLANLRIESGAGGLKPMSPINMIIGPADIGVVAKVDAATAEVDVDFEILVIAN